MAASCVDGISVFLLRSVNGGIEHQAPDHPCEISAVFGARASNRERGFFRAPQVSFDSSDVSASREDAEDRYGVCFWHSSSVWCLEFPRRVPLVAQLRGDGADEAWIARSTGVISAKAHSRQKSQRRWRRAIARLACIASFELLKDSIDRL